MPSVLDSRASAVAAGNGHACALTNGGDAQCWGYNAFGQLGNGSTANAATPVSVANFGGGGVSIATGGSHTCALMTTGQVQCWGLNGSGQLGNGSTASASAPVAVAGLGNAIAIAAGDAHTCALTTTGGVQCWGSNGNGQLGNGATQNSALPVAVTNLPGDVTSIAAGGTHTCAMTAGGSVYCWGGNGSGQLGNDSTTDASAPVAVVGLSGAATALATGYRHTCAATSGGVQCWGYNVYGQLGDGSTTSASRPVTVANLSGSVTAIAAGKYQTCVLLAGMRCWGWNANGQLGNDSTANSTTPVAVLGLAGSVASIAMGASQTCTLTTTGGLQCWGGNGNGQIGNGTTADVHLPVAVAGFSTAVAVGVRNIVIAGSPVAAPADTFVTSGAHTCAVTNAGGVQCWGDNTYGQLGVGSTTRFYQPVAVHNLASGVSAIATGDSHTCALTGAGTVQCWGRNSGGQLGNGTTADASEPVVVSGLSGVAAIAAGGNHTCALMNAGGVQCWGFNNYGQLGNGSTASASTPVGVGGLSGNGVAISTGWLHTCVLTSAGNVQCWGRNFDGELGNGSTTGATTPVTVTGLSGAVAIAAGGLHSCAVTSAGGAQCWGANIYGELGNGTFASSSVPVTVTGLNGNAATIAAGQQHTCAATTAGAVQCWGYNGNGQLGNGTTTRSTTPVMVIGLGAGAAAISARGNRSCALTRGGGARCWGDPSYGSTPSANSTPITQLGAQALRFNPPSLLAAGGQIVLSPTTSTDSGGVAGSFDSWTPDVCVVTEMYSGALSVLKPGLCGVRASRNGNYTLNNVSWAGTAQQLRLMRIAQAQPVLMLATSGSPSAPGAGVIFTANLAGAATPSGNVSFCLDAAVTNASCGGQTPLCVVAAGAAPITCSTSALTPGSHALTAYFAGDANNAAAKTDDALIQLVGTAPAFTSATAATFEIAQHGSFTITASGTPAPYIGLAPDRSLPMGVSLVDNGDGTATLSGTPANGSAGTYALRFIASGPIAPDASQNFTLTVQKASSALALSAMPTAAVYGQSVLLSATLASANAQAGGAVLFIADGATAPGCDARPLTAGQASCPVAGLGVGSHAMLATYMGDANTSVSALATPIVVTVAKAATAVTLVPPGPITLGDAVEVTATVAVVAPGAGDLSGSIAIGDGDAGAGDSCTIVLPATQCSLTPSRSGKKALTAVFTPDAAADTNFAGSSASGSLIVNEPIRYRIGGQLSGPGGSITLRLDATNPAATQSKTLTANGAFVFDTGLLAGSNWNVSASAQPAAQLCSVQNGSGKDLAADVNTVAVTCAAAHVVTATVVGGHGMIAPASQSVADGASASFNVMPNPGFEVRAVSGDTCTVMQQGSSGVWTTSAITQACVVTATFADYPSQCSGTRGYRATFFDDFPGDALDPSRWSANANGGTIAVADNGVSLDSSVARFPFVTSAGTPIPAEGMFSVRWLARYTGSGGAGDGSLVLSKGLPANGADDDYALRRADTWQDANAGFQMRLRTVDGGGYDAIATDRPPTVGALHDIEYCWLKETLEVWIDGVRTVQSPHADLSRPDGLWFGNPVVTGSEAVWNPFTLYYVEVRALDDEIFRDGFDP